MQPNLNFRFIHAADLHLDSPLQGLEAYEDAPVTTIREATRKALANLVDLCLSEQVAFLLIAGDVFDGEWKSMGTGRYFADQMARLSKAKIPVFLIKGNHDAASQISQSIEIPGVYTFSHKAPETFDIEDLGVALHGQSYKSAETKENLAANYPAPRKGKLNIGLLHTCGTGGSTLHAPYAPCTVPELVAKGYDYWALGHVHQRDILWEDPPIIFPGNIQGRHVREPAAEGKGVTLVHVQGGSIDRFAHIPLDTVRWDVLRIDVSGSPSVEHVYDVVASAVKHAQLRLDGRLLAVRLIIEGICSASSSIHENPNGFDQGLRSYVQGHLDAVWLEEIRVKTQSEAIDNLPVDEGSLSDLLEFIRTAEPEGQLSPLEEKLNTLKEKLKVLPSEFLTDCGLDDPHLMTSLLPDIEETVLALARGVKS